ncbi:MAG: DUF2157 domain-containing protein [Polyangiaceae bacterium]|nr:DUF2157 domain-containing protein [Polyangiaceae bacterium]
MSGQRHIPHRTWLRDELEGLVRAGVLDEPAAARLRAHYRLDELAPGVNRMLLAFAVMGAGLFGAGVILLVAHNWEEMTRPMRAALCFALLVAAQGLSVFALARRGSSDAWREASAAFLTASFGAALSLVSQTYHTGGELGDLALGWVALTIPIVYALEARVSGALLFLLALYLPLGRDHAMDQGYLFFGALGALAPFVYRSSRQFAGETRTSALELFFAASLSIGAGLLVGRDASAMTGVFLIALFVLIRLGSAMREERGAVGALALGALAFVSLVLTFNDVHPKPHEASFAEGAWAAATLLVTAAAIFLFERSSAERRADELPIGLGVIVAWVGAGVCLFEDGSVYAAILWNLYVLALGLERLVTGLRSFDRRRSNFGLLLLALLFALRFFDTDLSFIIRGLGMMAIGVAFLAVNLHLGRRGTEGAR